MARRPHLLISDIAMPGEDGYSLIRKLRARGGLVPAIAVTAHVSCEESDRALSEGFQAFVPKPIDPDKLIILLANLAGENKGQIGAQATQPRNS